MSERTCSFPGCGRPHKGRGLCPGHLRQHRLGYELWPLGEKPRRAPDRCSFSGCDYTVKCRGLCEGHYFQRHRAGKELTPLRARAVDGRYTAATGYVIVRSPSHPLRRTDGSVREHRAVLFDAIGPGSHPCHWCGCVVAWDSHYLSDDTLVVDHLDWDRGNNSRDNLVPSCRSCNSARPRTSGTIRLMLPLVLGAVLAIAAIGVAVTGTRHDRQRGARRTVDRRLAEWAGAVRRRYGGLAALLVVGLAGTWLAVAAGGWVLLRALEARRRRARWW